MIQNINYDRIVEQGYEDGILYVEAEYLNGQVKSLLISNLIDSSQNFKITRTDSLVVYSGDRLQDIHQNKIKEIVFYCKDEESAKLVESTLHDRQLVKCMAKCNIKDSKQRNKDTFKTIIVVIVIATLIIVCMNRKGGGL